VTITEEGVRTLKDRRARQNAAIAAAITELDDEAAAKLSQVVPILKQMSSRLKDAPPS